MLKSQTIVLSNELAIKLRTFIPVANAYYKSRAVSICIPWLNSFCFLWCHQCLWIQIKGSLFSAHKPKEVNSSDKSLGPSVSWSIRYKIQPLFSVNDFLGATSAGESSSFTRCSKDQSSRDEASDAPIIKGIGWFYRAVLIYILQ